MKTIIYTIIATCLLAIPITAQAQWARLVPIAYGIKILSDKYAEHEKEEMLKKEIENKMLFRERDKESSLYNPMTDPYSSNRNNIFSGSNNSEAELLINNINPNSELAKALKKSVDKHVSDDNQMRETNLQTKITNTFNCLHKQKPYIYLAENEGIITNQILSDLEKEGKSHLTEKQIIARIKYCNKSLPKILKTKPEPEKTKTIPVEINYASQNAAPIPNEPEQIPTKVYIEQQQKPKPEKNGGLAWFIVAILGLIAAIYGANRLLSPISKVENDANIPPKGNAEPIFDATKGKRALDIKHEGPNWLILK